MQAFDEMFPNVPYAGQEPRDHYAAYAQWLSHQQPQDVARLQAEAEVIFRRVGITFAVYGDKDEDGMGNERLIPFDLLPRIIPQQE